VSLLMDALRKAEQQKQQLAAQGQQGQSEPEAKPLQGLALEPLSHQSEPEVPGAQPFAPVPEKAAASPGIPFSADISAKTTKGGRLPELPTRLEDLDEQFMAHAAQPPLRVQPVPVAAPLLSPAPPPARDKAIEASPESARKLFEAKQPAQKNNRSFAIAIGLVSLVAAIGIGGYFWWQLQPKGGLVASGAPVAPPMPAAPIAAAPATAVPPVPTFPSPATAPQPAQRDYGDSDAPPAKRTETKPAQQVPASAKPESPIRLTTAQQKTDPLLDQAYQAFNRGDSTLAQTQWQKVLAADPRNADALHGLAAVAQQRQQPNEAADYYLRALEANPKDALALSGLVSIRTSANAEQTESRLKNMLTEQPDSPYLNFALGNLYARSMRWAEAQQSFFRAHAADSANPDYLFNLAVSLDHLHQPRLAVQYYNQALTAVAQQPAGFDAAQVAARLKVLQSGL
jgi:Tfp pilus assembly protein PilF